MPGIQTNNFDLGAHTGKTQNLINIRCMDIFFQNLVRERSGSVVECLTWDQVAADSSLTGVTALWSLSKTHLASLVLV